MKRWRSWLFIFCFLSLSSLLICNAHLEAEKIIEGDRATAGQFPYQVFIEVHGLAICGGTIIDEWHVVTAAHCIVNEKTFEFEEKNYKVVGGTLNSKFKDPTHQSVLVEKIFVPKEYAKKYGDTSDIAVLKLEEPLKLNGNTYMKKIDLPDDKYTYAGTQAIVTGYGHTWLRLLRINGEIEEGDGGNTDNTLYFAKTNILDRRTCQQNHDQIITDQHICAKVLQKYYFSPSGVCSGDSGGPLVYNNRVLIGVVSSSPLGCRENISSGIYTRVSEFLDFIEKARNDVNDPEIMTRTVKKNYSPISISSLWDLILNDINM